MIATNARTNAPGIGAVNSLLGAYRTQLALAIISASVLALQVTFTRIFSIIIWYHFTYLIVGITLLGGGAAGTYLAVRQWDKKTLQSRISKIAALYSLSILITLLVITQFSFDPLTRSDIQATIIGLALYFVSLFVAFFLGGLSVAAVFTLRSDQAHRLYFADLLGASAGTLLIVTIIQAITGPGAIILIATIALIASALLSTNPTPAWKYGTWIGILAEIALVIYVGFINPIQLKIPPSKELGAALEAGTVTRSEYVSWNPVARVDVLPEQSFPIPPVVGGVSSTYTFDPSQPYLAHIVTMDATSATAIFKYNGDISRFDFLNHALIAAPFIVSTPQPTTLNIGIGGGIDILLARLYGASDITAIDINSDIVGLLKGRYAQYFGNLNRDPSIHIQTAEGRGFLMRGSARYDIIQGIGLDNFAALSGGAYVLSESYIYTVDAFNLALSRLTDNGIFSWTRSVTEPSREMIRLVGLSAEALRLSGVTNPAEHIALVANEDQTIATLLVSPSPFSQEQVTKLRDWAEQNKFVMLHDPLARLDTVYTDYLTAPDPRAFEQAYPFNIYPVTDDNPYFYNYFKWTDLDFSRDENNGDVNLRFPIGNIILIIMLALSLITAFVFIIFPLVRYQRQGIKSQNALPMLAYFSLLGLSYITVEIVLIQRFTLFIGYPTHAITATIFSMLFFSALGSLAAEHLCRTPRQLQMMMIALVAAIVGYVIALQPILAALQQFSDTWRIILTVVIIAPLATLMGMPFPTGIRQLHRGGDMLVPWAWGMNGVFSVIGSVLVILISMVTNFTMALVVAGVLYAIAILLSRSLWVQKSARTTLNG